MQNAISSLSQFSFNILFLEIRFLPLVFIIFILTLVLVFYKKLNYKNISFGIVVLLMLLLGQISSDHYMIQKIYNIQNNWHYVAYLIFAILMYNFLYSKKKSSEYIILLTFLAALLISTLDETFQKFMTNRVFDVSDIAKDVWGTIIGLIIVFFIYKKGEIYKKAWKLRKKSIKEYFKEPFTLLVLLSIFTYVLLFVSSLLTDFQYLTNIIFITILLFVFIFIIIHLTNFRLLRIFFSILAVLGILYLGFTAIKTQNTSIKVLKKHFLIYQGIPLPYFDVMIKPNGVFKFMDKKQNFLQTDINMLFNQNADIILIGSGFNGEGGKGFAQDSEAQFMFDPISKKSIQLIIMETRKASKEYNRLKKEGYKVLFIIHN